MQLGQCRRMSEDVWCVVITFFSALQELHSTFNNTLHKSLSQPSRCRTVHSFIGLSAFMQGLVGPIMCYYGLSRVVRAD